MTQYLVTIFRPEGYDPASETAAMREEISALNREMIAAGARKFAGGLQDPATARAIRVRNSGEVLVSDGPYLETKEQAGGLWLLEAPDLDAALEWGRKAAIACRAGVEVRPFN